ncbi:unknown [[Mannheimia] succiniciproducens MBEL55E]|uniref:Uncharacterized protein n=1 Tax=Mannheimia succiniciproducens (strain KCTC 0769BP / MBEL55E) TaxID=221988 RepID=Q65W19_MANSM|nr:unknown [[Mannheimia] succiniciproducens MBEL55E]
MCHNLSRIIDLKFLLMINYAIILHNYLKINNYLDYRHETTA